MLPVTHTYNSTYAHTIAKNAKKLKMITSVSVNLSLAAVAVYSCLSESQTVTCSLRHPTTIRRITPQRRSTAAISQHPTVNQRETRCWFQNGKKTNAIFLFLQKNSSLLSIIKKKPRKTEEFTNTWDIVPKNSESETWRNEHKWDIE